MKALILAAGKGTRLNPHTNDTPKCLLKVKDKELLEFQLDSLHTNDIKDITIVTGYLADKVQKKAGNRAKFVFNSMYDKGGILFSFQIVKDQFYGKEFVCLASDIIFNRDILGLILNTEGDIVIGVERKECDGEDTKALIENNEIKITGKKLQPLNSNESLAEFVHIYKFSPKGSKIFFNHVENLIKEGRNHAYMTDALNNAIKEGLRMIPAYSNGLKRMEIDFIEDLEKARNMKWY